MEKKKPRKIKDPCPVCESELYYNKDYSKRIGLREKGNVLGWMCPECNTEFDLKDNILYIYGEENIKGKA